MTQMRGKVGGGLVIHRCVVLKKKIEKIEKEQEGGMREEGDEGE